MVRVLRGVRGVVGLDGEPFYARLVSRSLRVSVFLGRPLRQPGGSVTGFRRGDGFGPLFTQALWRLVEEADDLLVVSEGTAGHEAAVDLPDLGGRRDEGDLPYESFLASWPTVIARYYEVHRRRPAAVGQADGRRGDRPGSLLRFDRTHQVGAALCTDGRWRWSEGPERNVRLGSDYGVPVSDDQARLIAADLGHPSEVVADEAGPRPGPVSPSRR